MTQHQNHGNHDHGSLKSYVIGFVLSIVLTIIPLVLVMNQMLEKTALVITILVMAILQFVVQLFFFMHIRERKTALQCTDIDPRSRDRVYDHRRFHLDHDVQQILSRIIVKSQKA